MEEELTGARVLDETAGRRHSRCAKGPVVALPAEWICAVDGSLLLGMTGNPESMLSLGLVARSMNEQSVNVLLQGSEL